MELKFSQKKIRTTMSALEEQIARHDYDAAEASAIKLKQLIQGRKLKALNQVEEVREYEYYAFISYSRKDEEWAAWLQESLETYKFSEAQRKQNPNLPEKIFPVFRDKTDLSGGILEKQLCDQLYKSEYLIVIYSPNSAKAEWVNKEILYFLSLGGEDRLERVIPVIVDGEAHSRDPKLSK